MRNVVLLRWLFNIRPTDTNFPRFQSAQPDHVRVQSSSCSFPRELVSFIRPRELVSFNPRHVTSSPSIGKRIWVGRYNNSFSQWRGNLIRKTTAINGCFPWGKAFSVLVYPNWINTIRSIFGRNKMCQPLNWNRREFITETFSTVQQCFELRSFFECASNFRWTINFVFQ